MGVRYLEIVSVKGGFTSHSIIINVTIFICCRQWQLTLRAVVFFVSSTYFFRLVLFQSRTLVERVCFGSAKARP